jgi:hypothetical protein
MKAILYAVLTVAAVLTLTAAIVAMAPYVAIIIVIGLLAYFLMDNPPPE